MFIRIIYFILDSQCFFCFVQKLFVKKGLDIKDSVLCLDQFLGPELGAENALRNTRDGRWLRGPQRTMPGMTCNQREKKEGS